jgi:superfamily I DNA/RNA helicase
VQAYNASLRAAISELGDRAGNAQPLTAEGGAALPFHELPTRLQLLLVAQLHGRLQRQYAPAQARAAETEDASLADLLATAERQAPRCLAWVRDQKQQGCMPSWEAYKQQYGHAATEQPSWHQRLARIGAAYQAELARRGLAALSDLPLLARRALAAGGEAAAWARRRWGHVLVDEFQDTGPCMVAWRVTLCRTAFKL